MMIKKLLALSLFFTTLYGAPEAAPELNDKFSDSTNCKKCHMHIVKQWALSYHAKSHYNSDEYFRKSIDYVQRKTRKPINAVKVQCAACHNPRISVTSTGIDYEIDSVMKLTKGSAVNKAVANKALAEGINCLVCHNVDKVHKGLPESKRGIHRIKWNRVGIMSGPFEDAKSPYHKTQERDFFSKDSKQLCFVCHANDRSESNLIFANTKAEYKKSSKLCADCHMSPKKVGIASNLPIDNGKPKKRMIREHGFVGAHTNWLWEDALTLTGVIDKGQLLMTLHNENPHNIPTGFGARELILDITFMSGSSTLKSSSISLTQHYKDRRGKKTIPHLAVEASAEQSVPAKGKKQVAIALHKDATNAIVTLSYRLVNDEVRTLLKLKETQWSEKKFITKTNIRF